jgi:pimeloyl-ACP methyl ester carboxylesterase
MGRLLSLRVILPAAVFLALVIYVLMAFAMVYQATRPEERKPFEAHPADFGMSYEDVSFTTRNGTLTLQGWLLKGSPGSPYLIFVHGLGSQRTDTQSLELAARLVRDEGYSVLLFDLRAHGTSAGDRITAGHRERDDVLGAYDFILSRGAQPGRVGLRGLCYGAGIAIMAAAHEPGIAAVVADSTFASVEARAAHEIARRTPIPESLAPGFMPPARLIADLIYGIDLGELKPERDVEKLGYPVLIIHGEADTRIPFSQAQRVYAASPAGSQLWALPGVEHAQAFPTEQDQYLERVKAYLASRLAGGPQSSSAPLPE